MSRTLTASDRKSLIRLAGTMPVGSPERKAILASEGLLKIAKVTDADVEGINEYFYYLDHTGAALALFQVLNMAREAEIMEHVLDIEALMGGLPRDLVKFRASMLKSAYAAAKRVKMPNGEALYDQLRR